MALLLKWSIILFFESIQIQSNFCTNLFYYKNTFSKINIMSFERIRRVCAQITYVRQYIFLVIFWHILRYKQNIKNLIFHLKLYTSIHYYIKNIKTLELFIHQSWPQGILSIETKILFKFPYWKIFGCQSNKKLPSKSTVPEPSESISSIIMSRSSVVILSSNSLKISLRTSVVI